jgi:hypothetical protein
MLRLTAILATLTLGLVACDSSKKEAAPDNKAQPAAKIPEAAPPKMEDKPIPPADKMDDPADPADPADEPEGEEIE